MNSGERRIFTARCRFYLNAAAEHGLTLKEVCEPISYDGVTKNNDLPLFFFAEFIKK